MRRKLLLLSVLCFFFSGIWAQGSAFGIKGGLTLGTQKWNSIDRDPLFGYHGIAYIESLDDAFALFAQVGYHLKGSALRNRNFFNPVSGNLGRLPVQTFEFQNISLSVGGKQKYDFRDNAKVYYLFGIRGDYTIGNNLGEYTDFNTGYFPFPDFVRDINFGLILGGGIEFMFTELTGGLLEFTVNPDISAQYRQPEIPNVTDPFTGNPRTINERIIRNLTFEVTLGIRLLRKVEYID